MAKNISCKKTNRANNRPNCLKITKHPQKVNLKTIKIDGKKYRISVREVRALKKAFSE